MGRSAVVGGRGRPAVYAAWAAMPVSAHALLLRSNPASNAVLEQAPAQVELFFSEAVQPGLSTVSVLDSEGRASRPRRRACRCQQSDADDRLAWVRC